MKGAIKMTCRVFVYGTLMKNCYNHDYFLKDQKHLGQAVLPGYALYNLGSFPGIIPDSQEIVMGELYEIDREILRRLDILEGNGNLYIRHSAQVQQQDTAIETQVYVCNGQVHQEDKIEFDAQPWNNEYGR